MTTSANVQDWLAIHRLLIEEESAFTDLAIKAAEGAVPADELARRRADLMALRERCAEAYARAFPQ